MEKIISLFVFGAILSVVAPIIGVLFGAFSGWTVGLIFQETIMGFLDRIGIDTAGLTMWQLGAALGFIGGFLKTSVYSKKD